MGEDLERKRRQNEKRLRDKKLQENLMTRTLFSSASGAYTTVFRCAGAKHRAAIGCGDPLLIRDPGKGRVEVLKAGLLVGTMGGIDADGLREILKKEERIVGMCLGEVVSLEDDDSFRVKLRPINPGKSGRQTDNEADQAAEL